MAASIVLLERSSSRMFTLGLADRKRLRLGTMNPFNELLLANSLTLPFSPLAKPLTSPCMRSTPASSERTCLSTNAPSAVSSMPRASRLNSGTPIANSRFFSR
ncbi:hypothetical protein D3C72_1383950 [compost metagenome]